MLFRSPVAPAAPVVSGSPSVSAAAGAGASASPTSSAAANPGETELVMADGNRTFVFQAPFTKLSAQQAVTALTRLALDAYQNTLPPAPSASASPSPSLSSAKA